MFSGESMFMATYKAERGPGMIAFSSSFPGSIVALDLAQGQNIVCQKGAFLAASKSVTLAVHLQKKLGAGLFGGEGLFLTTLTGPGNIWLQSMPAQKVANVIILYLPAKSDSGSGDDS
ncbi:MAG: AIM24 family protein [Synergistaceae bacterium]|nr:AIM24 family protein [Synergistaceae bacterium]